MKEHPLALGFFQTRQHLSHSAWIRNCEPSDAALLGRGLETLSIEELDSLDKLIDKSQRLTSPWLHTHIVNPSASNDLALWYQAPLASEWMKDWGY